MKSNKTNNKLKNQYAFPKPILKWVGGKTQILDKLMNEFPDSINNYHEIFLGGGSVLIALLSLSKNGLIKINGKIFAYDLNEQLISVYKNIQSNNCCMTCNPPAGAKGAPGAAGATGAGAGAAPFVNFSNWLLQDVTSNPTNPVADFWNWLFSDPPKKQCSKAT